jgi:chromate reductase, NAD(P)H dehydrogenase (quinone)
MIEYSFLFKGMSLMYNIATIIGSLRKDSFNKKFMHALDKLDHPKLKFNILNIETIPLFNQDHEQDMPAPAAKMKKEVAESDGVLFLTPEYNRSIPGVLKNIIDWGTRPYGQNVWKNKPTGILGVSPGVIGTAVAQSHLRSILGSIAVPVLGEPEVYLVYKEGLIDDNFNITNENTKKFLQSFLDRFSQWVEDLK